MNRIQQFLIIAGVLFIGGSYFLYRQISHAGDRWPAFGKPGSLTADITRLNHDINNLRLEVAKIPEANEKLEEIKVEYELASTVLPRENSPHQLIAAIRLKAQKAGIVPYSLSPAVVRSGGGRRSQGSFEEWSFTLNLRGTYDQIGTFINSMEEFESTDQARVGSERRFFKVNQIDITSENNGLSFLLTDEGARLGHQCTLVMSTFRYTGEN